MGHCRDRVQDNWKVVANAKFRPNQRTITKKQVLLVEEEEEEEGKMQDNRGKEGTRR